jgi:DNA-binding HxlR family transcriptional regulator
MIFVPHPAAADLYDLAGERWTVPVLSSLRDGTLRFGEIRRSLMGLSQKQLTQTLRHLERDGFVRRTVYPTIPPRVDYQLTDLGSSLIVPLFEIGRFAVERGEEIAKARKRFDEASFQHGYQVNAPASPLIRSGAL